MNCKQSCRNTCRRLQLIDFLTVLAIDCEQSVFIPQMLRVRENVNLCKFGGKNEEGMEKREENDFLFPLFRSHTSWDSRLCRSPLESFTFSCHFIFAKLGKERDCSQSTLAGVTSVQVGFHSSKTLVHCTIPKSTTKCTDLNDERCCE